MFEKIDELIREKKISYYRFAKETGISESTISRWKSKKTKPSIDTLLIAAKYFDVPLERLI